MKILIVFLLIVSSVLANSDGIIDKTHKGVVNTLDNNVDVLPESLQGEAKSLVKDIDKDGKNVNFLLKVSLAENAHDIYIDGVDTLERNVMLWTAGARFLPNTWKIDVSYTGFIGEDVVTSGDGGGDAQDNKLLINEGKNDVQIINFYTKPLHTKYGSFGLGYSYYEYYGELSTYQDYKVLDYQNSAKNGAMLLDADGKNSVRYQFDIEKYYFTYSIPSTKKWYNGFGVSYVYEKSDIAHAFKDGLAINPDGTTSMILVGINKTLDEVKPGLSFKTFSVGLSETKIEIFNYDTNKNDSYTYESTPFDVELIYMLKPKKDKQFYFSARLQVREDDDYSRSEIYLESGLLF